MCLKQWGWRASLGSAPSTFYSPRPQQPVLMLKLTAAENNTESSGWRHWVREVSQVPGGRWITQTASVMDEATLCPHWDKHLN